MTIEEKAKRYDEAKYIMKEYLESGNVGVIAENTIKKAFPELKESKDEKIRKAIIGGLEEMKNSFHTISSVKIDDAIAWLEKQAKKDEEILILKDQIESLHAAIKAIKETHRIELEKQDEQKPMDKIQLGKKYKCIASPRYTMFMIGKIYKPEDKFLCSLMNFCSDCFEPIEDKQNPAIDMITPEESLGIDSDTYSKIVDECVYGEQKSALSKEKSNQKQDVNIQINPSEYINDMGGNGCYLKNTTQASAWSEEDERIRKELIEYIRKTTCVNFIGKCSKKEAEKFISWLERNGENKEINEVSYRIGIKRVLDNPESYGLEKQGEQKSIDEIAKEINKDKTSAIAFLKASGIINENGELAEQYRQGEQKPAEWYKQDETLLNCCLGAINTTDYFDNDNKDEMEKWLKSLKDRVQPQPKLEWNEE